MCSDVYLTGTSTLSHTPTASQYKSFRSITSNTAYKNTNKFYNQHSSSQPEYEQYFEKVDEPAAGKKTKKHTLFTYALGKIKLFRVKESVYFQKLVKYSTRSESHPHTYTRHPARTIPSIMDIDPCEEQFPFEEQRMEEHDDDGSEDIESLIEEIFGGNDDDDEEEEDNISQHDQDEAEDGYIMWGNDSRSRF
uniref:Uncharacterized protein LOC111109529 n=1 Tax=Crassostrea virginica TaxID=6565 RepID=A0A8B8BF44_CRAVI|nr:uncharacterized protein LOC111109529 [Crassostrea virginica]